MRGRSERECEACREQQYQRREGNGSYDSPPLGFGDMSLVPQELAVIRL